MKRGFYVLAGVLLLVGLPFAQELGSPIKVATQGNSCRWSQLAFGPDGVAHIVYMAKDVGTSFDDLVFYVSYDGTTKSTPLRISALGGHADRPGIAVGPNGTIVIVWGDSYSVYMRVYNPTQAAWQPIEAVKLSYGGDEPAVCLDRDGNIFVWFCDDEGGRVYTRAKINGVWEDTKRIDTQTRRAKTGGIAMGRDGRIWALWNEKNPETGEYKGYYRWRTKTTGWSEARIINEAGASWSHPYITVGPDNIPLVSTGDVDEGASNLQEMWVVAINEQGNPREMAIPAYLQHYPRIAADKWGRYLACAIGGGDFGDGVRYTYRSGGGTWSDPQTYGGAWPKVPGISADGYGNVAICWSHIRFGQGSDILLASKLPISKKQAYAPQSPSASVVFETEDDVKKIAYTFSWGANSQNKDAEMEGYQVYKRTSGGAWGPAVFVDKANFTAKYSLTELTSGLEFAVATVLLSGLESSKVTFPAVTYPLDPPQNVSANYRLTGLKTTPLLKVDITWQAPSADKPKDEYIQGYNIYKKEGTGEFKLFKEIAKGQTSATFTFDTSQTKLQFAMTTLTVFKLESSLVVIGPTPSETGASRSRLIGK